jgi:hypothetical protein
MKTGGEREMFDHNYVCVLNQWTDRERESAREREREGDTDRNEANE